MGNRKTIYLAITLLLAFASSSLGLGPQYIGTSKSISGVLQTNISDGSIVHVYQAFDTIHPPDYYGEPHLYNVLLKEIKIGEGVDPKAINSGQFSCILDRTQGVSFFVRVFDNGFYRDSPLYQITYRNKPILIDIEDVNIPLDDRDFDSDGLNNSWEKLYDTNEKNADTDNDGYSDAEEICLNTNPNNSNDFLTVYGIEQYDNELLFTWDARGIEYFVEHTTNYLNDTNIAWNVIDTNIFGFVFITNDYPYSIFRVRVDCE
jgi:hypothetical protein